MLNSLLTCILLMTLVKIINIDKNEIYILSCLECSLQFSSKCLSAYVTLNFVCQLLQCLE